MESDAPVDAPVSDLAEIRLRTATLRTARSAATRERIRAAARTAADSDTPLTVKEVARLARVSRSTFYSHYEDLDELAVDILAEDLLEHPFSTAALVDVYVRNRVLYRGVLEEASSRRVMETAVRIVALALVESTDVASPRGSARLMRLAQFTAWGYIGTLDDWLRADDPAPVDDLLAFLRDHTPPELAG